MKIKWHHIDSFSGNYSRPELVYSRPCPICAATIPKTVYEFTDFQFYTDSIEQPKHVSVRHCQCSVCFAVYMNPCYSAYGFSVLFSEAGQSYGSTAARPKEQLSWLTYRGLLQEGYRVLDVGCYDGSFLSKLPANLNKVGVDIDKLAIDRGKITYQNERIEFIHGDFENFSYQTDRPDIITMFHVLEHLPRPIAVLKKLRSISNDTTKLVVEVPILENGKTNDINGFLSIQHMTHFSRGSLRNTLLRSGWDIQEWIEMPDYNGCRVLATPGVEQVIQKGEPNDVFYLHDYMAAWHKTLAKIEFDLASFREYKRFVIWGAGAHSEFLYQTTSFFHASMDRNYIMVDSDPLKHNRTWRGIPISNPDILKGIDWSDLYLLISSYGGQDSIAAAAIKLGVSEEKIVKIYENVHVY